MAWGAAAGAGAEAVVMTMTSNDMAAVNSFEEPMKLSPVTSNVMLQKGTLNAQVPSHSFVVYRLKIK